jgi:hypothetical protein
VHAPCYNESMSESNRTIPFAAGPTEATAAGVTMTAGELIRHLSHFTPDTPVTVALPDGSWWLNVEGASDPNETGEQSVILHTRDDFDTRQF